MDKVTARVNEAVAVAVRRTLDAKPDVENRNAYGHSVGKRIQGTYGAELRKVAESRPSLSAEELFAIVIAPTEFPWDSEALDLRETIEAGARDRIRKRNYGQRADLSIPIPADLSDRVNEIRKLIEAKGTR